jgi:oxygen-independent coproporphyrinogen-3 oxidase
LRSKKYVAGIYIHIPFCKQACHYCDFHFSTNRTDQSALVRAITRELQLQRNYLNGEVINTIYFGGGTPSLLTRDELSSIVGTIRSDYPIDDAPEITLEANPGDLTNTKLHELTDCGINRLSIGIQSFQDTILQYLNRDHDGASAIRSVNDARESGINNISIDLIYSIPNQSDETWKENIRQAIALNPEHISAYSLTIEQKTVFGNWASKKKLVPVDDDTAARQLEILIDDLASAGYEQYEVSNFCRPGFYSRHNSSYWKGERYLGVGPAAHSYDIDSRQSNIRNNGVYVKSLREDKIPFERELLTRDDKVNDYLLTTLRTSWGSDLGLLEKIYHYDIRGEHRAYVDELITHGLATLDGDRLTLTRKGRLLADKIAADLFLTS